MIVRIATQTLRWSESVTPSESRKMFIDSIENPVGRRFFGYS